MSDKWEFWELVSMEYNLSSSFIREYQDNLDWYFLAQNQSVPLAIFEEMEEHVEEWETLFWSRKHALPEPFIEKYMDRLEDIETACVSQTLSEAFIEKYQDKVDWAGIFRFQKLSETFLERHVEKMDWATIANYQSLSYEFVIKHIRKLDYSSLRKNVNLQFTKEQWDAIKTTKKGIKLQRKEDKDGLGSNINTRKSK